MSIVVKEKRRGRTLSANDATVLYLVFGSGVDAGNVLDDDAFSAVAGVATAEYFGLPATDIQVRQELVQGTVWEVAVLYSAQNPGGPLAQPTVNYEFSFQAPQERIYRSLRTFGAYDKNGAINTNRFGNLINVTPTSVDGVDLSAGTPTNVWQYNPLHASVTDAYQSSVEQACGAVCNVDFMGRPQGSMRLVGVQGGALFSQGTYPKWSIRFAFQHAREFYNVKCGPITIPYLPAHYYAWSHNEMHPVENDTAENYAVHFQPTYVFVEQVYQELDLRQYLGFG